MPEQDPRPTNGRLKAAILGHQLAELRKDHDELKAQVAGSVRLEIKFAALAERVDAQGSTLKWVLGLAGTGVIGSGLTLLKLVLG